MSNGNETDWAGLVLKLIAGRAEKPWLEFKRDNTNPEQIGKTMSAVANSAVLHGQPYAYILWGIADDSLDIVGAKFVPEKKKKSSQQLESWLHQQLGKKVAFQFQHVLVENKPVVILEIDAQINYPVAFAGERYFRIGDSIDNLKNSPEKERELWRCFDRQLFESKRAADNKSADAVLKLLDYNAYFDLAGEMPPATRDGVLTVLRGKGMIEQSRGNKWNILNLGALLLAKNMEEFPHLARKTPRIICYEGNDRAKTVKDESITSGYVSGFEELMQFIKGVIPIKETIVNGLREEEKFAFTALRELIANALIHQDLTATGQRIMIEVFDNRVEITSPGAPLIAPARFVDTAQSRNEALAGLMRRCRICEERGSGVDKAIEEIETYHLPPPLFQKAPNVTRAILYKKTDLRRISREDGIRACYLHACLRGLSGQAMTNLSLRERLQIPKNKIVDATRLIKDTLERRLIIIENEQVGTKSRRYLPYWVRHDDNYLG